MNLTSKKYTIKELEAFIANNILTYDDWYYISLLQTLTIDFTEKYHDKLNWFTISETQKLSEDFIVKFSDKVDWDMIVLHQKLSYEFLEKHLYKYSLCITIGVNLKHLNKLKKKYPYKCYIDTLYDSIK